MEKHFGRVLTVLARWVIVTLSVSLLLFATSGTSRISSLRNYLATFSAFLLATMLAIDPQLAQERSGVLQKSATPERTLASLFFVITLGLAAFEVGRIHSLPSVPVHARQAGLVLFAAALSLQLWAMVVNPFFSPEVRLQSERGHRLITGGPYRLVRHPGYLAMLVAVPSSAVAIGSWLALAPAAAFCLTILNRVAAEEKFLLQNLAGYPEYLARVRGRLLPQMDSIRLSRRSQLSYSARASDRTRP